MSRPRWKLIAALAVPVVVLGASVGGYLAYTNGLRYLDRPEDLPNIEYVKRQVPRLESMGQEKATTLLMRHRSARRLYENFLYWEDRKAGYGHGILFSWTEGKLQVTKLHPRAIELIMARHDPRLKDIEPAIPANPGVERPGND